MAVLPVILLLFYAFIFVLAVQIHNLLAFCCLAICILLILFPHSLVK
jgi:hypothetical protein